MSQLQIQSWVDESGWSSMSQISSPALIHQDLEKGHGVPAWLLRSAPADPVEEGSLKAESAP